MASKSMVFYQSWLETARKLPDPKDAVYQLIEYGISGRKCLADDVATEVFFSMATPSIDSNEQKKRGGAPEGNQNAKGNKGGGAPKGNRNAAKKTNTKNKLNLSDVNEDVNVDVNEDVNIFGGDTPPLEAGGGLAGEELDRMLAQINAESGDDDDG